MHVIFKRCCKRGRNSHYCCKPIFRFRLKPGLQAAFVVPPSDGSGQNAHCCKPRNAFVDDFTGGSALPVVVISAGEVAEVGEGNETFEDQVVVDLAVGAFTGTGMFLALDKGINRCWRVCYFYGGSCLVRCELIHSNMIQFELGAW